MLVIYWLVRSVCRGINAREFMSTRDMTTKLLLPYYPWFCFLNHAQHMLCQCKLSTFNKHHVIVHRIYLMEKPMITYNKICLNTSWHIHPWQVGLGFVVLMLKNTAKPYPLHVCGWSIPLTYSQETNSRSPMLIPISSKTKQIRL